MRSALSLDTTGAALAVPLGLAVDSPRPTVAGKFLYVGKEKLLLRGVTYGTFRPAAEETEYGSPEKVRRDFTQMAAHGINAVRTYTVPPVWLLDIAAATGMRVMLGLPWEQHIAFLADAARARSIEERLRAGVRNVAGHPAVLCYTVGNEIPAPIVRWHGRRPIERFIERLFLAAKEEDPKGLVTYVNYPTTEYLQLPFLDFVSFNVYLESKEILEAYLARLQNLAGDRPLVMAEIGLDSRRNGLAQQAESIEWQLRATFAAGCAGGFVFSWTDEWHRGGYDIDDWDFGLTTREREPKPALAAVREVFTDDPLPASSAKPMISIVVCTYNGARTIRDCMEGLFGLYYPNFEVIVIDDGSTDETAAIVAEYSVRLIRTENRGLSSARNTGFESAKGEIVAYIDDDARPDTHWLSFLADAFDRSEYVGVGGPNIAPPEAGWLASCVDNAPGGPIHVLLSDTVAEHIPGCNMAFRKRCLEEVGGFDVQFRSAGDDVDICWRLQEQGGVLGFHPGAMVWHHRRDSVKRYWRQQAGYGSAEADLERKWPDKYNAAGHPTWSGRIYGMGFSRLLTGGGRIYHGTWGTALFQSLYQPAPGLLRSLPLMPEWYVVVLLLAALSSAGALWEPLLFTLPVLVLAAGVPIVDGMLNASRARFAGRETRWRDRLKLQTVTAFLHLLQPAARLFGRLRSGLTPWRRHGVAALALPRRSETSIWSEQWKSSEEWVAGIESALRAAGSVVRRGGEFDRWDLGVRGGLLGGSRLRLVTEEHGGGRQLLRIESTPHCSAVAFVLTGLFAALAILASVDGAVGASVLLCLSGVAITAVTLWECAVSTGACRRVTESLRDLRAAAPAGVDVPVGNAEPLI